MSLAKIAKTAKVGKAEFDVRRILFWKLNLWFFLAPLAILARDILTQPAA
jgi:hypothetical protein